jgi:AAA domain
MSVTSTLNSPAEQILKVPVQNNSSLFGLQEPYFSKFDYLVYVGTKQPCGSVHNVVLPSMTKGRKVLFIDLDPQATASSHFLGKLYREQEPTIYTALTTFKPIPPIIVNERLHLLSAHIALEQAEVSLPQ